MSGLAAVTTEVILSPEEAQLARTAVRKYLAKLRNNYRNDLRRAGREHFADTHLRKFDNYLDLYELLGGDPDDIPDPEDVETDAPAGLSPTKEATR